MHRHEAHDVVGGLRDARVLRVAAAALVGEPASERAQATPASRGEGASLLDELCDVGGRLPPSQPVSATSISRVRRPLTDEPRERGAGPEPVQVEKLGEGLATDSGLSVGRRR